MTIQREKDKCSLIYAAHHHHSLRAAHDETNMTGLTAASSLGDHSPLTTNDTPCAEQALDARGQGLLSGRNETGAGAVDASCKVVSLTSRRRVQSSQCSQGFQHQPVQSRQCAEPTPTFDTPKPALITTLDRVDEVRRIAGEPSIVVTGRPHSKRFNPDPLAPSKAANTNAVKPKLSRKARRKAADIPLLLNKTWRDLKRTEKVCLAMAAIEREGGEAISLNFGLQRQLSCQRLQDPRRAFEKALNKQLGVAGLPGLKIVMTLEVTPDGCGSQSRVHAHGAAATVGLTGDQHDRLRTALCNAASIAVGAIGGDRQLVMKPMTCASGWMDYCLDDQAKTRKALGIGNLWVMTRQAQRAAKALHGECTKARTREAA